MPTWIKNSIIANLALSLLAVLVAYGAFNLARYGLELKKESWGAQKKIEELARKNQGLEAALTELETKEASERMAKERLNLKLPGEKVVVLVPHDLSASQADDSVKDSGFLKFWNQVKNFFSKISVSLGLRTQ